jgi:metallophosphoesterase (TIGR03767 family)
MIRGVRRRRRGSVLAPALVLATVIAAVVAAPERRASAQSGGPAATTLDGTVTGGDPKQGFALVKGGPGEAFLTREDVAQAQPGREQRRRSLIYFGQVSDFQLSDEESPARVEFLDPDPSGFARSAWRPQEPLLAQLVDWSIRQLNGLTDSPVAQGDGKRAHMTNAVLTGDLADNQQRNETEWVLREIDGGRLDPNSGTDQTLDPLCPSPALLDDPKHYTGVQDYTDYNASAPTFYDPNTPKGIYASWPKYPGLLDRAQQPFDAAGIDVPSYVVFGNHDGLVQGNVNANAAYVKIATGCVKPLTPEPSFNKPQDVPASLVDFIPVPANPDPSYLASVIGDPSKVMTVPPDLSRRMLTKVEYKNVFRKGAQKDGHGFGLVDPAEEKASNGSAGYYAWTPKAGVRFIVMDTLAEAGELPDSSDGNIDDPQFKWLEAQLKQATDRDEVVVVFSHHARSSLVANHPDEDSTDCSSEDPASEPNPGCDRDPRDSAPVHLGDDLEALLHRYPHVLAHVAGHSHENQVNAYKSDKGGGYWEVKSAAIADWPPQHRVMDVMDNCDGTLSLFGAVVDPGVPLDAPASGTAAAGMDERTLASVARLITYNDPQEGPDGSEGKPKDRNVELVMRDPRRSPPACSGQGGGASLKLTLKPKTVRAGRRTCFRFLVTTAGRPVKGAAVKFTGRRVTTDSKGRARMCRALYLNRSRKASATKRGYRPGRAAVRVTGTRR